MKVNPIAIFLVSLVLCNTSFGSPFDTIDEDTSNDGNDEETVSHEENENIIESHENNIEEKINSDEKQEKVIESDNHKSDEKILNDEIHEEEKKPIKSFEELSNIKLKIVDINTGIKSEVTLKSGEYYNLKGIGLKLQRCFKSVDGTNLSLGYIIVSGADFKTQTVIVSSEVGLSKTIASKYIVKAECF